MCLAFVLLLVGGHACLLSTHDKAHGARIMPTRTGSRFYLLFAVGVFRLSPIEHKHMSCAIEHTRRATPAKRMASSPLSGTTHLQMVFDCEFMRKNWCRLRYLKNSLASCKHWGCRLYVRRKHYNRRSLRTFCSQAMCQQVSLQAWPSAHCFRALDINLCESGKTDMSSSQTLTAGHLKGHLEGHAHQSTMDAKYYY